ncbi:MAG TPA: S53 family peptidase [Terriglobia bacterium]|nr:S53 family peptidase [Terriglobia bacterium]
MPAKHYLAVRGSKREPMPGAISTGPCDPSERMQVTVVLRQRPSSKHFKTVSQLAARGERLTRAQFEARYGADPKDVERVTAFAAENKLKVSKVNAGARTVILSGTAGDFSRAFQVRLDRYERPEGAFRGRTGPVRVPAALRNIIKAVHGLDNRPQARAHCRIASAAVAGSYTPQQVATLYDFPRGLTGQGQTIGIIELGGGYSQFDLDSYFKALGISPSPSVSSVSVDSGKNQPTGDPNGPDAEVMLDIEVAGAVAPAARIVVYFAPNTDAGFLDAINQSVMDKQNKPSVISISWGGPESTWTSQSLKSYNAALQSAAAIGVTVCVACGDNGSSDGVTDGMAHADFPASSPYALACGGTHLVGSGGSITDEEVWNNLPNNGATGGGVSDTFPLPSWQNGANVPPSVNPGNRKGRGLPDLAGDADPQTGYQVEVDGSNAVVGGTSAAAPLLAGLIALLNQALTGPVGYFNPGLYKKVAISPGTFRDITLGNNGAYQARPGWDACTGWGSPVGANILSALTPSKAP